MVDFVTPKWIFMITVVVKLKKLYKDLIKYTFHFTNNDPLSSLMPWKITKSLFELSNGDDWGVFITLRVPRIVVTFV